MSFEVCSNVISKCAILAAKTSLLSLDSKYICNENHLVEDMCSKAKVYPSTAEIFNLRCSPVIFDYHNS